MKIADAVTLIHTSGIASDSPAVWADLGCGSGLFTRALATLLAPQSQIMAVDKQQHEKEEKTTNAVQIHFLQADFVNDILPFAALDGVLMANALHYVADKKRFLQKMQPVIKKEALWIIVEYDTLRANPWVPYPINFQNLKQLFLEAGYKNSRKTGERRSIYNAGTMYCAAIKL